MRIGIDARFLSHPQPGGFKTYTENLINALSEIDSENEYILYLDRQPERYSKIPKESNFFPRVIPGETPYLGMVWREQIGLPKAVKEDQVDLLHSLCLTAPLRVPCASVVTIHDMIWYYPSKYSGSTRLAGRRRFIQWYFRYIPIFAARKAKAIITVSEASKRNIKNLLNIPAENILITHEAASKDFRKLDDISLAGELKSKYDIRNDFIFAIGSADPRKNIQTLIDAYAALSHEVKDQYQLIILWTHQSLSLSINKIIQEKSIQNHVKFISNLNEQELLVIYNAASLFIFPSLEEGFGLPPLEAMACGTPVIAANNSSIPEIVGDAAILFDAENPMELTNAILEVTQSENIQNRLIDKGLKRAAFFSWQKCAISTLRVYEKVYSSE